MSIIGAVLSLVCFALCGNATRNRYQMYGWKDNWFFFYLVLALYNGWAFLSYF
jgi:hypothetical protein